jgi:hypothetical protein
VLEAEQGGMDGLALYLLQDEEGLVVGKETYNLVFYRALN